VVLCFRSDKPGWYFAIQEKSEVSLIIQAGRMIDSKGFALLQCCLRDFVILVDEVVAYLCIQIAAFGYVSKSR